MAVNGQPAIASWIGTRYFAVDYDGGSDANLGYSDVSMAAAGVVAVKTLERLDQIWPRFGNGQKVVVAIKTRAAGATYRNPGNTADSNLDLHDYAGYSYLAVRATDTQATAGAVAFANDAADRIYSGGRIVPGTNAGGYNPVAAITANTFNVQLNGGGAPGLTAEPALLGKRIRFDSATTTVALRNATAMIWANAAASMTVGPNLPAVPVAADIFYIEEPGVAVSRMLMRGNVDNNATLAGSTAGMFLVGIRAVDTVSASGFFAEGCDTLSVCFCQEDNTTNFNFILGSRTFKIDRSFIAEDGVTTTNVGSGIRCAGGLFISGCYTVSVQRFAIIGVLQATASVSLTIGSDAYATAVTVQAANAALLGNFSSATTQKLRLNGGAAGVVVKFTAIAVPSIAGTNVSMRGVDIQNAGANALIQPGINNAAIELNDVTGSTGNTGAGLDLTNGAHNCSIVIGALTPCTFTGGAGQDILAVGPVRYVHADYVRGNLTDQFGNRIQGPALGTIIGPTTLMVNDGNADIGQFKICRTTATGVVRAAIATTNALASGVSGVSQSPFTAAGPQKAMLVNGGGTWVQFDAAPAAGAIAYLSDVTAGNARDTPPALLATNQKLRLGRVMMVSGTLGFINWSPENLPVLSDGLP